MDPTGPFEDDPNLTDKRYPGNPTRSYRTRAPLRVLGEVTDWEDHPPEALKAMRDHLRAAGHRGHQRVTPLRLHERWLGPPDQPPREPQIQYSEPARRVLELVGTEPEGRHRMRYEISRADRAPLPAQYRSEARYLGYRTPDESRPYAKYFQANTRPIQEHVVHALVAGMAPTEYGYGVDEAADRLARPGYQGMETGWTRLDNGVIQVNVLTAMPGVTAQMWDWWFGWHSRETARYKLWFPDAHQFAALGEDRGADRTLTDRQRYVDNVSYVDEYIGGTLQPLAIRFVDPVRMGIADLPGATHICARVSFSTMPVAFGWLVHQVRPTDDGAEMRSRFFLNDPRMLDLPASALPTSLASRALGNPLGRALAKPALPVAAARMMPSSLPTDMIYHCAAEMNHLASFLPDLYEEFRDSV